MDTDDEQRAPRDRHGAPRGERRRVHEDQPPPAGGAGPHSHGFGGSPECQLCPICVVLQALGTTRPEVTSHLLAAAREIAIAFKTAAEGQVEAADRAQAVMRDRLTRIDID